MNDIIIKDNCIIDAKDFTGEILIIPSTVKEILAYAFFEHPTIKQVIFEGDSCIIKADMFKDCKNLEKIVFPKNNKILPSNVCRGCTVLSDVTLPEKLEIIENNAFDFCINLEHILLPETLKKIDAYAFSCTNIKQIKIPKNVDYLDISVFNGCASLKEILVDKSFYEKYKNTPLIKHENNLIKIINMDTLLEEGASFSKINKTYKSWEQEI